MATAEYEDVLRIAETLSPLDRVRLARELTEPKRPSSGKTRSILELEGLGKEIWEGVDVKAYIAEERDSWER
jgi:hypothetical protein